MTNLEYQISTFKLNQEGKVNLQFVGSSIQIGNINYKYLAEGLAKRVYTSPCGNYVLKIPKDNKSYQLDQIYHEVEAYNQAPEWCKNNIAKSYLLQNGWMLQERLTIKQSNNHFRELGVRDDGTVVIFDVDVLLEGCFKKPKNGYLYEKNFSLLKAFGKAYTEAIRLPKVRRQERNRKIKEKYGENFKYLETYNSMSDKTLIYINDVLLSDEDAKLFIER